MIKFIKKMIYHTGKYPLMAIVDLQSYPTARKAINMPDKIVLDTLYQGQPILLIALYQQGQLRPDVGRLLRIAKDMGFYTLGINNATLAEPSTDCFDCYIERFNYGRDFASYKVGFEHVFEIMKKTPCPRLLMINDSIYYDTSRLAPFLETMMKTTVEVLGATENEEIMPHLGSFCISMSGTILQHPHFQAFWAHYALTNLRPNVIRRGELGLSACLKKCVSSPDQFQALYGVSFLERNLSSQNDIDTFVRLKRRSQIISMKNLPDSPTRSDILTYFKARNQIHINNTYLVHMGLPIVKLDLYYRGVFSDEDVKLLCEQLPENERQELYHLLCKRPYGMKSLKGFQKILFMWGLI